MLRFDPELLRALGVREADASVIRVRGDSMLPTLAEGDEILVDCADRKLPRRGGLFVIRIDGALSVKRLVPDADGIAVISDNPAFPPIGTRPAATLKILGRVAWLGRRL